MNEVFEKEIEHIAKRLETLEHTVYGNGHKGLKAELIELKTEIETFKKSPSGKWVSSSPSSAPC